MGNSPYKTHTDFGNMFPTSIEPTLNTLAVDWEGAVGNQGYPVLLFLRGSDLELPRASFHGTSSADEIARLLPLHREGTGPDP